MRLFHTVTVSVFCRPKDEDEALTKEKLVALFPFDLKQEKVPLDVQHATGFNNSPISILSVTIAKETHLTRFFDALLAHLNEEQKRAILQEAGSRLDAELCFYLRFDKRQWNEHQELWIVDHGDCYHCRASIAAFPKKREVAMQVVKELFSH